MAGAAKVTTNVIDLTNRVSPSGIFASAMVIASKIGPVNVPILISGQSDFLKKCTVDETLGIGWDNAFYEAWNYLKIQPNLYVVRAAHTEGPLKCLYGGIKLRTMKSAFNHEGFKQGFSIKQSAADEVPFVDIDLDYRPYYVLDPETEIKEDPITKQKYIEVNGETRYVTKMGSDYVVYECEDDTCCVIYSASEGDFANRIAIQIITDKEQVKLDDCFIIRVYKQNSEKQYLKVEEHLVSLDPSLKDGYGVSCYIESVLGASKYIRALVNPLSYVNKSTSTILKVIGKVTLKNPYIYTTNVFENSKRHEVGDVIKVEYITNKPAFYEVTTAGQSAASTSKSTWVSTSTNEYMDKVVEGTITWKLRDMVVPYQLATSYTTGQTVQVQAGLYYKAMTSGVTGTVRPTWGNEKAGEYITDNDIIWTKQEQEYTFLEEEAYSNYVGSSETLPANYIVYKDKYLGTPYTYKKQVTVTDYTTVDSVYGTHKQKVYELNLPGTANSSYRIEVTGDETDEFYVLPKPSTKDETGSLELFKMSGGFDGSIVETGDRIKALNTLNSLADYQFQLMQDGGETTQTYANAILSLCSKRKEETHGIISTPIANELGRLTGDASTDIISYRKDYMPSTKLLELYTTHQLVYDEFNDRNIYVSPSCFMTANILKYARELGWHWAVAGYTRGKIPSLDVACTFTEDELDFLADSQVNAIIKEPGEGIVAWDEQTLLSNACDQQDAHIARYVDLYLRPTLKAFLKYYLFEFNDEETRTLVAQRMDVFMKAEEAARAVYDYRVVCDESNNTAADIEANRMNVWLFIKATKIAKYIPLTIILTPYSVDFDQAATMF